MHLDLWPAPMRAGLCGGSRLPIRGGVASTPEFGGRPEAKQRPLPFCVCETGALGEAPSPGGVRTDVVATLMETMEPFARFCSPSSFSLGDYAAEHAESVLSLSAT